MCFRLAALLVLMPLLSACDAYDRTLVGRYKLQAIDTYDDMSIVWRLDGDATVGDGLPGPMVFAAGYDERYVVAAVHHRGIKGPFGGDKYREEKKRLGLPDFTWHNPKS